MNGYEFQVLSNNIILLTSSNNINSYFKNILRGILLY